MYKKFYKINYLQNTLNISFRSAKNLQRNLKMFRVAVPIDITWVDGLADLKFTPPWCLYFFNIAS
jgi:hypothetical protein